MSDDLIYSEFLKALQNYDRAKAIEVAQLALQNNQISIPDLYEKVLAPSLNQVASNTREQEIAIWEEHLYSGIVRSVVESVFPYTQALWKPIGKKAIVLCLEEEYHELGARMTLDYLTLLGFDGYFIGANTPKNEALSAINHFKPDLVCISVTNYFHLTRLHGFIDALKRSNTEKSFKLLVGGYAIHHSSNVKDSLKADYYASTYKDLETVKEDIL